MKYKMMGAKKFLEIAKPGTLFIPIEIWGYNSEADERLHKIIEMFKQNPQDIYNTYWDKLHIFVDNGGSITFTYNVVLCDEENNYIYYYDYNVVGDADPEHTLYLVVDSIEDIPDHINFWCYGDNIGRVEFPDDFVIYNTATKLYDHYLHLTKNRIEKLYESILDTECREASEDSNEWAKNELAKRNNPILDLDIEIEV